MVFGQVAYMMKDFLPESQFLLVLITVIIIILCVGTIFFFWFYTKQLLKLHHTIIQKQNETEIKTKQEIAYVLHEEVSKNLTFIKWNIKKIETKLSEFDQDADVIEGLDYCQSVFQQTDSAQQLIRRLHKTIYPPALHVLDFSEACKNLLNEHQKEFSGKIHFEWNDKFENLNHQVKFNLYGLINLFVTNSIQHSLAHEIWVKVLRKNKQIELLMSDNGRGFDMKEIEKKAAGRGVFDIKSRAISLFPLVFEYQSEKGKGTNLLIVLDQKI